MLDDILDLDFTDPPAPEFHRERDHSGIEHAALTASFFLATTAKPQPLMGYAICLTGECYAVGGREYISRELTKLGAVVKSGVTRKCTHLLVGTEPGVVKQRKARELGIERLDEDWLEKTFKDNGVSCNGADMAWLD